MEGPRAPSINSRSRSLIRFRESAGGGPVPITTVPGAACTLVVSRVDLAVGPFVGPDQAVLGRIGPITTRPCVRGGFAVCGEVLFRPA